MNIILSIVITDTCAEIHLLAFHRIVQTDFFGCIQASSHHTTKPTWTTTVVNIIYSANQRELAGVIAMTRETVDIGIQRIAVFCTCSGIQVTNPSLVHTFLYLNIKNGFFFTVINTGNTGVVRLSVVSIDLVNHICRQVLQTGLHITTEEFLTVHQEFLDFLTVQLHITVIVHFCTWNLLYQFFQCSAFRSTVC